MRVTIQFLYHQAHEYDLCDKSNKKIIKFFIGSFVVIVLKLQSGKYYPSNNFVN